MVPGTAYAFFDTPIPYDEIERYVRYAPVDARASGAPNPYPDSLEVLCERLDDALPRLSADPYLHQVAAFAQRDELPYVLSATVTEQSNKDVADCLADLLNYLDGESTQEYPLRGQIAYREAETGPFRLHD